MSNFLFGSFSILIDFPYKSGPYLELRYLKLSVCRPFLSVPSVIFGVFPILHFEHLNEAFEWIILSISGIRMSITALSKVCSEVCSLFFQHRSCNNMSSVKRKLSVKSLGEKFQVLRNLEKVSQTKTSLQSMVYPETAFPRGLKPNQSILLHWNNHRIKRNKTKKQWLWKSWSRMLELLQRFESMHLYDTARKQSSILTYYLSENKIPNSKNINIFSLSYYYLEDLPKSIQK